jgi:hypothetical protein
MSMVFPTTREEWAFHNRLEDERFDREHGSTSHDCTLEPFCTEDPECEFAQCQTCGASNGLCRCDDLYERFMGK